MARQVKREKLAKASLAKANTITFEIEGVYEDDRQKFQAMAQNLGITFDSNNNVLDNDIKDDVLANTSSITDIEGYFATTYTGDITVVTSVDFTGQTTTTSTISVVNGIVTGVS